MQLKPLSNNILIEPVVKEEKTEGGIVIPDTAEKDRPVQGKVVAVGPGKLNDKREITPVSVKVGDIVLFKKYSPDEIELDNKKYLVVREDDIIGIVS